jgi:hypothetical protein
MMALTEILGIGSWVLLLAVSPQASGDVRLSPEVVAKAFLAGRIEAGSSSSDTDVEPSPVEQYSAARCRPSRFAGTYHCILKVKYRYSRRWFAIDQKLHWTIERGWIAAAE